MKFLLTIIPWLLSATYCLSQQEKYIYEPSQQNPFGLLNPEAPPQTGGYALIIGQSRCKSITRKPDGTWNADSVDMMWRFKYIMNGKAVQDETLKADGKHSGSIRQYNADSARWYVTFFNIAASPQPSVWSGNNEGDRIILYKRQQAPNGADGYYRITFENITREHFDWRGEWVDLKEEFVYPTWKIYCKKEQ